MIRALAPFGPLVLALLAIPAAILPAADLVQQQPVRDGGAPQRLGTAVLSGIVLDDSSGQPLSHATVTATSATSGPNETITDAAGRFAIAQLTAGRYTLTARKPAYLTAALGATRPPRPGRIPVGSPIPVADGQRVGGLVVRLHRGAVITGHLLDPRGQPARGTTVTVAYSTRSSTGARVLQMLQSQGSLLVQGSRISVSTDDQGTYRLYGIPPGDYVVVATPGFDRFALERLAFDSLRPTTDADVERALATARSGGSSPLAAPPAESRAVAYGPVYYPGTAIAADASVVTVAAGEERSAVDFQIQLVPTARIEGTVVGVDGQPAPGVSARILSDSPRVSEGSVLDASGVTDAHGHFRVTGLSPGSYTVAVLTGDGPPGSGRGGVPTTAVRMWAQADVVLQGEDVTTNLTLRPCVTVSGRVVLDPAPSAGAKDAPQAAVALEAAPGGIVDGVHREASTDAFGAFSFFGIAPGRYQLIAGVLDRARGSVDKSWTVRSVIVAGRDVTETPIEIGASGDVTDVVVTLIDRTTLVTGKLLDAAGQPVPEYVLIAFPADRALWTWQSRRIQTARPAMDGAFTFQSLPAGAYRIAAVTDVDQNDWFDPNLLALLVPQSVALTLGEGEHRTQDIRVR